MSTKTIILILGFVAAFLLAGPICIAAETKPESIFKEDQPKQWGKWFQLTDEGVEHFMGKIAKENPEKAAELKKLQESDPEKFRQQLRATMRESFKGKAKKYHKGKGYKGHKKECPPEGEGDFRGDHRGKHHDKAEEHPCRGGSGGGRRGKRGGHHKEHIKWLEENYPDKAKELAQLKEKDPKKYKEYLWHGLKKYWKIADADKHNPQLAAILKEDLELKGQRNELLKQIASADKNQKAALTAELTQLVSKRYDLILNRKQIEYEGLLKRVEKMKSRLEEKKTKLQQWKDPKYKDQNINNRLEELAGKTETFKWE